MFQQAVPNVQFPVASDKYERGAGGNSGEQTYNNMNINILTQIPISIV